MNSQQAINLLNGLEQRLDDYCELNNEGKAAFRMAITALELFGNAEQLPSAQPTIEPRKKGKWIPVSEELPKKEQWNESFLVTVQCEHVDGWDDYVVCGAEYSEYGWEYIPFPIGAIKVVAWMPITIEPYKSEDKQ